MTGYFAFGVFLAAALAGAAFFVDGFSALALAATAFFGAGLGAFAASALSGAGFSVGVPTTSLAACWSAVVSTVSFARAVADLPASAFALGSAAGAGLASALGASLLLRLVIADRDDLQDRVVLAVALLAAIIVAAALLEHRHLVAPGLGDDLGRDLEAVGRLQAAAVAGEQDVAERDLVTGLAVELLDDDLVSGVDAILLSARAHDCEHWLFSF
jgi:signal transduction histidine kinase